MLTTKQRHGGYVYAVTDGEYIKIGCTKDPQKRLAQIQTGNARPCSFLLLIPTEREADAYQLESILHRYCEPYRKCGEWFDLIPFPGLPTQTEIVHRCEAPGTRIRDTKEWVIKAINESGGVIAIKDLNDLAFETGISPRTLCRAKTALASDNKIKFSQKGYGKDKCFYAMTCKGA